MWLARNSQPRGALIIMWGKEKLRCGQRDQREDHLGSNYDHWLSAWPLSAESVSRDQKTEARLQTSRVGSSSSILESPLAVPWPLILHTHCLLETLLYHVSRNRKHNGESEIVKPKSQSPDLTNTQVSVKEAYGLDTKKWPVHSGSLSIILSSCDTIVVSVTGSFFESH